MGLPAENFKAYVEADASQKVKNIPTDAFFLIHGLADATAPYHHSIQLAKKLTEQRIIYRYMVNGSYSKKKKTFVKNPFFSVSLSFHIIKFVAMPFLALEH